MSSRSQGRQRESRFRPSNTTPSRPGPATSIAIPTNEIRKNNEDDSHRYDGDSISNPNSSTTAANPIKTPSKPSGRPIGIPTPILMPSNTFENPKPLPKRTTPAPSSSLRASATPSTSNVAAFSTQILGSSPGTRIKSYATPVPIGVGVGGNSTQEIAGKINIPTSLLRKTPTPSSGPPSRRLSSSSGSVKGKESAASSSSIAAIAGSMLPNKRRMSFSNQDKGGDRKKAHTSTKPNQRKVPPRGSRPSKPASAFVLFSKQRRPEIEKHSASAKGPKFDINARVKSNWNSLTKEEKEPFEKESKQLKKEYDLAMQAFREIYGNSDEEEEEEEENESDLSENNENQEPNSNSTTKTKRRSSSTVTAASVAQTLSTSIEKNTPPAQPANSYFLFKNDFLQKREGTQKDLSNGAISTAWQALSANERAIYSSKAEALRREWEKEMEEWKRTHSDEEEEEEEGADVDEKKMKKRKGTGKKDSNSIKRPKNPTISDDEAEYLAEIDTQKNSNQQPQRLDNRSTAMSELSEIRFNKGRASQKTFELERKLRDDKRERAKIRKQMRLHNVRTEEELMGLVGEKKKEEQDQDVALLQSMTTNKRVAEPASDEESILDGHTTATEGEEEEEAEVEDGAQSEAESIGAASTSTHHTLRDKKFSIRTRIVDGKIVLDESSLQQARNNDAGYNDQAEMIDINESDRFVNSSTHSKRRQRNDRWNLEETEKFLQSVSMWGSDFEMIARMFPHRNRTQIRSKWRSMERTNSHSLDLAFKRRLPVNLEEYSRLAGVDLSGEVPQIDLPDYRNIKKVEGEDDADDVDVDAQTKGFGKALKSTMDEPPILKKAEPEYDENGLEIVEEGDDLDPTSLPSTAKLPRLTRSSKTRSSSRKNDDTSMPPPPSATAINQNIVEELDIPRTRRVRSSSLASQTGATSISLSTSNLHGASSAAASDRERRQRKIREEERKQRERARRRPIPSGDEEILE